MLDDKARKRQDKTTANPESTTTNNEKPEPTETTADSNNGDDNEDGNGNGDGGKNDFKVNFKDDGSFPQNGHVFAVRQSSGGLLGDLVDMDDLNVVTYSWELVGKVKAKTANLVVIPKDLKSGRQLVATKGVGAGSNDKSSRRKLDSKFFEDVGTNSATMDMERFTSDLERLQEENLSIMIHWEDPDNKNAEGYTYSPYFTVTGSNDLQKWRELNDRIEKLGTVAQNGQEDTQIPKDGLTEWDGNEIGSGNGDSGNGDGGVPTDGGPTNTGTRSVAPTSTGIDDGGSSSDSGGGGGGISTGAIAGIVVGVVLFLGLIGVLAWFLIRRRKSKSKAGGYADPSQNVTSNAYIVDKVDPNGHSQSPYSDDGMGQHTPLDPHTNHNYSQDSNQGAFRDGPHPSGIDDDDSHPMAGAQAPRRPGAAGRNYSHLVEEGMTEDDIRRMEDEERQLDAEIERAGRR